MSDKSPTTRKEYNNLYQDIRKRLAGNTEAESAIDRLVEIIESTRDKKTGEISPKHAYLSTHVGKRVLQHLIKTGFSSSVLWSEAEQLLGRSKSTIEKYISYHKLNRARPRYLKWTVERIDIVKRRFAESQSVRSKELLSKLRNETLTEINRLPGQTVSWNAINCFARAQIPLLSWGMTVEQKRTHDAAVFKRICSDPNLSAEEKRAALCAELRYKSTRKLLERAIDCGCVEEAEQLMLPRGNNFKTSVAALEKEIRNHLAERIAAGDLVNPTLGADKLYDVIHVKFADRLKEARVPFTKKDFSALLDGVIRTLKRTRNVKMAMKADLSPEEYQAEDRNIPLGIVERWFQERRGVTTKLHPPVFLKGLEDFDAALQREVLRLPKGSFENPIQLPEAAVFKGGIDIFNGLEMGIDYPKDMEDNLVRCAFSSARKRRVGALILTNVMDIHVKKTASSNMIDLAALSGHLLDESAIELLDPLYQDTARQVLREIKQDPTTERMIYIKPIDVVKLTLKACYKVAYATDPKTGKRKPEFDGPVKLILSHKDHEIVKALAGTRSADNTISWHGKVSARLRLAEAALARMENEGATDEEIVDQESKIAALRVEREYTRVSHSAKNNSDRYRKQMLSLLIRGYQAAIPNCTVVGKGTTLFSVGKQTLEVHIPGSVKVSEAALRRYADNYAPKVFRGEFADAVVICPTYSFNYRQRAAEHTGEGKRKSSPIFVAPPLIDAEYLRQKEHTGDILPTNVHPLLSVLRSEITCPGVLHLDFHGANHEIVSPATFPVSTLRSDSQTPKWERPKGMLNVITTKAYGAEPYFCFYVATDPHRGGRARELIWSPEKRMYLGIHEAALDLMERGGLYTDPLFPVPTFFVICDDIVQGLHFDAYNQTHPHLISQGDMEQLWAEELTRAKTSGDKVRYATLLEEMHKELSYQRRIQGTDWMEDQLLEAQEEMVTPYGEFFHLLLENAVDCGLELRGMSHYQEGVRSDKRDVGFVSYTVSGNHHRNTVKGAVAEGNRMRDHTRGAVLSLPHIDRWRKDPAILKRIVRTVDFSGEGIGGGTVALPGGKPWGIMYRESGTRLGNWGDPVSATLRKELARGDHLGFQRSVDSTLQIFGNWHFDASAEAEWLKAEMGAPGTHTDRYGQKGFPPNNTGVKFILIPARGPGYGPILRRTLMSWNLRYYIEENPKAVFNWKHFLPNVIRAA